ncbi:glutamate--tRNA ligase [Anaplasmataceae bacterium AB001_6]|nr:glutamate--tRNA ligase [Anaplasmataceae bacterium AB001_6]
MKNVVRFAPSPTGNFHIGSVRTALFNWLFAKKTEGSFILRIEDTDKNRSKTSYTEAILENIRWLGLDYDDLTYQTDNSDRHVEVVEELLLLGRAYRENFSDGSSVVRIKSGEDGNSTFNDLVYGQITVDNKQNEDTVILRSDGTPTYMIAVVVDDHDSGVTHIIRGSDHINNTFKQIAIYEALGWKIPTFCHIPLIHDQEGRKLSKRDNDVVDLQDFRRLGFFPEAIISYLVRLGWSCNSDEVLQLHQIRDLFTLEGIGKSPSKYDFNKLCSINGYFMRNILDLEYMYETILSNEAFLSLGLNENKQKIFKDILPFYIQRSVNIVDLVKNMAFITDGFLDDLDADVLSQLKININRDIMRKFYENVRDNEIFDSSYLRLLIKELCIQYKKRDILVSLRASVICNLSSPSILDLLVALGKNFVLKRIEFFLNL